VPVAFAITVPAEGLTNRLSGLALPGAVALAVVLLVISRLFWRRVGIRHYSGASAQYTLADIPWRSVCGAETRQCPWCTITAWPNIP